MGAFIAAGAGFEGEIAVVGVWRGVDVAVVGRVVDIWCGFS
jgi:hypothetical protein